MTPRRPDPGIDHGEVHGIRRHERGGAGECQRTLRHVVARDRMSEIDDAGVGRDLGHDAAAHTGEFVLEAVVGKEDDEARHACGGVTVPAGGAASGSSSGASCASSCASSYGVS